MRDGKINKILTPIADKWVILSLILFFPLGLFLMWTRTHWQKITKWLVTGFFGFVLLSSLLGNSNTKVADLSSSKTQQATATQTPTSIHTPTPKPTTQVYKTGDNSLYPNYSFTPGETFSSATASQICVSGYTATVRSVSDSLRQQVFAEYGIPYANHANYEVDHFIPLELGGDNSIKNLWPEYGSIPNPKDKVENYLHSQVCSGSMSLEEAQNEIVSDWYAVYSRVYGGNINTYVAPTSSTANSTTTTATSTNQNGATALCNDGTYSYAANHQGACSRHNGVNIFYK
jgi:hypothetical protein